MFFIGVSATAFGTLYAAPPRDDHVFNCFFNLAIVALFAGVVLLAPWYKQHKSTNRLVYGINAQIPPNPSAQQLPLRLPPDKATRGETQRSNDNEKEKEARSSRQMTFSELTMNEIGRLLNYKNHPYEAAIAHLALAAARSAESLTYLAEIDDRRFGGVWTRDNHPDACVDDGHVRWAATGALTSLGNRSAEPSLGSASLA
jgi:hypothetical protein